MEEAAEFVWDCASLIAIPGSATRFVRSAAHSQLKARHTFTTEGEIHSQLKAKYTLTTEGETYTHN